MIRKRVAADAYTVAWFCITEEEVVAALAALDEEHEPPKYDGEMSYHFGEINGSQGPHNIVIICSGKAGKTPMAEASTMLRNVKEFSLDDAFLVGIAGGLSNELYRGDVVVASPVNDNEAVRQHDLIQDKHRLDQTATNLRSRFDHWHRDHQRGHTNASDILSEMIKSHADFAAPDPKDDVLYRPQDKHIGEINDCTLCMKKYEGRQRSALRVKDRYTLTLHRGLLLTGDQLVRNSEEKARIMSMHPDALCVDMESAALMNQWHPLVIRGISDYADTHYGWNWTRYAAATAAAVAKDIIAGLPSGSARSRRKDSRASSSEVRWPPESHPKSSREQEFGESMARSQSFDRSQRQSVRTSHDTGSEISYEKSSTPPSEVPSDGRVSRSNSSYSVEHSAIPLRSTTRKIATNAPSSTLRQITTPPRASGQSGSRSSPLRKVSTESGADNEALHRDEAMKLIVACQSDNTAERASSLIDRGANLQARDAYGCTALHYAVKRKTTRLTEKLLDKDPALSHVQNRRGRTALHLCAIDCTTASYAHAEIILQRNVDVNVKEVNSKTAFDCITAQNETTDKMKQLLRKYGAANHGP